MASDDESFVDFSIVGGRVVPQIRMPLLATVLELKDRIEGRVNVKPMRQSLLYNGEELENAQLIKNYNFKQSARVTLAVTLLEADPKFYVLLRSNIKDEEDFVQTRETYLVSDLKRKIGRHWGTPPENLTLFRLGDEMEDELPLYAYYVCEGSLIDVKFKIDPR